MSSILSESTPFFGVRSRPWEAGRRTVSPSRRLARTVFADVATVTVATAAAVATSIPTGPIGWVFAFDLVTLLVLRVRGQRTSIRSSLFDDVTTTVACTVVAAAAVITSRSVVAPHLDIAGQTLRLGACVAAGLLVTRTAGFFVGRALGRDGVGNTLIVGAGAVGRQVAARLRERPEWGLRPVGFLDKDPLHHVDTGDLPVLGASWHLEELVERHGVRSIVFTFSTAPHHVYLDLIRRSHQLQLEVLLVPRLFEQVTGQVDLAHVGGMPLLHIRPVSPSGWKLSAKYVLDRVVAGSALVAVAPAMLAIAIAVRLTSPGPVFFRQPRMGQGGRQFDMLKFRTMTGSPDVNGEADATWIARALEGEHGESLLVDQPVDRRTPVGRVLRRFSLDELPQLINVLRGEMSLVGPRPERMPLARTFEQSVYRYGDRHRVRGGITGWAQVQGLRGETSLADRVEWDNHYIENWTPWFDVKILVMTISVVFGWRHR